MSARTLRLSARSASSLSSSRDSARICSLRRSLTASTSAWRIASEVVDPSAVSSASARSDRSSVRKFSTAIRQEYDNMYDAATTRSDELLFSMLAQGPGVLWLTVSLSIETTRHQSVSGWNRTPPLGDSIMVMSETLPLANVKAEFSEMVDRVEHTHDRIIITMNGRPAAVLISPQELESLGDTLELLSDSVAMRELAESGKANESGDLIDSDELRRRFPAK